MNDKVYGRYNRVWISEDDFHQAIEFLGEYSPENSEIINRALIMAAIVAYVRPFLKSKGPLEDDSHQLAGGWKKDLTQEQVELHDKLIDFRNKAIAHADYEYRESRPMMLPSGRMTQTSKVFDVISEIDVEKFVELACKLRSYCGAKIIELKKRFT